MFDKFTVAARTAMKLARDECFTNQHGAIGTEHILYGLLKEDKGIAAAVLRQAGISLFKIRQLTRLERKDTPAPGIIPFTPNAKSALESAITEASQMRHIYIGPEHLLLGIILDEDSSATKILNELNVDIESLKSEAYDLLGETPVLVDSVEEESALTTTKKSSKKKTALSTFGRDITELARAKKLDPVIGRSKEIESTILTLLRRTKNNPILLGEPGVGKTAVVEGLAQYIVSGELKGPLSKCKIVALDLAAVIAGTKYRGQFEERIKAVIKEAIKEDTILFIDEIHTLIGAGGAEGSIDAANVLKPALARGELRCIGATTLNEYKKSIEKDAALDRRFQKVIVNEPSPEEAEDILRGLITRYEDFHHIKYGKDAIKTAVALSNRYISDRFLPDKAIDVIDECGANIVITNFKEGSSKTVADKDMIADTVSKITGIPVSALAKTELDRYLNIESKLDETVVGQAKAKRAVAKALIRSRSGLANPNRPIGCFLFLGPTGVGKTFLVKALAKAVFSSQNALITFDMSEYMEKHNASKLIGSPPGYVGFSEGGQLTERILRNPYSIVLFDEIEKAHPDVFNIFLQLMEEGYITDSSGRKVNCRNTIVIFTSNVGGSLLNRSTFGFLTESSEELAEKQISSAVEDMFRPEFINRLDAKIVFSKLNKEDMLKILDLEIGKVQERLFAKGIVLSVTAEARAFLLKEGWSDDYGARPMRRAVVKHIEDLLADALLAGEIQEITTIDFKDSSLYIK